MNGLGALDVTEEHVKRLNSSSLTQLLKQLLELEAREHSIDSPFINVPLDTTVPDEGIDGDISWDGAPDATPWLPARYTVFQCKATRMGPKKCCDEMLREGKLKPGIEKVLGQGGAYIIFCGRTMRNTEKAVAKMREAIESDGRHDPARALVKAYDARTVATWVNGHFEARLLALSLCGISLPYGLSLVSQLLDDVRFRGEYFTNDYLMDQMRTLRECAKQPKKVARVVGPSGLGKTRLVIEALNDRRTSDEECESLASGAIYLDASDLGKHVVGFVSEIAKSGKRAIVVVDECPMDVFEHLTRAVRGPSSNVSLVSIDIERRGEKDADRYVDLTPQQLSGVVRQMLDSAFSKQLSEGDIARIVEFTDGYPAMAALMADQRRRGLTDLGDLSDSVLLERMVWGRETPDEKDKRILSALALFEAVGLTGPYKGQACFVAENLCGLDARKPYDEFYAICKKYEKRLIVQTSGNYVFVTPQPLAFAMAADYWEAKPPETAFEDLEGLVEVGLLDRLCRRTAKLHYVSAVQVFGSSWLVDNSSKILSTSVGSRLFLCFSEVIPRKAVEALDLAIGTQTTEALLQIKGQIRRNLVSSLAQLVFWSDWFVKAAKALLRLAAAENESCANNATGLFLQLFHILLAGTQASYTERIECIQYALKSENPAERKLGIMACGSALQRHGFMRMMGSEVQGSRAVLPEYRPTTRDQVHDYRQQCLEILTKVACESEPLRADAKSQIAEHISVQLLDEYDACLKRVIHACGPLWPQAYSRIVGIVRREEDLPDDERSRLQGWLKLLEPVDLREKLELFVTKPPRDMEKTPEGRYIDKTAERVLAFAAEFLGKEDTLIPHLDVVLRGEQIYAHTFGHALAESELRGRLLDSALNILSELPFAQANLDFVSGMLSNEMAADIRQRCLERVFTDENLVKHVVLIARGVYLEDAELARLIEVLREGKISIESVGNLPFGRALAQVSSAMVGRLASVLSDLSGKGAAIALEILTMYTHGNNERWSKLRDEFASIVANPAVFDVDAGDGAFFNWKESVEKLLRDEAYARVAPAVVKMIINAASEQWVPHALPMEAKSVLGTALELHWPEVWPIIGKALLQKRGGPLVTLWLKAFRGMRPGDEEKRVLFGHNDDELLKWCKDTQPEGPKHIAELMPIFVQSGGNICWHPFAARMLELFGHLQKVRTSIGRNLGTGMFFGSRVPYLEQELALMRQLGTHPVTEVRKWACMRIAGLEGDIEIEAKRDQERDAGIY